MLATAKEKRQCLPRTQPSAPRSPVKAARSSPSGSSKRTAGPHLVLGAITKTRRSVRNELLSCNGTSGLNWELMVLRLNDEEHPCYTPSTSRACSENLPEAPPIH